MEFDEIESVLKWSAGAANLRELKLHTKSQQIVLRFPRSSPSIEEVDWAELSCQKAECIFESFVLMFFMNSREIIPHHEYIA